MNDDPTLFDDDDDEPDRYPNTAGYVHGSDTSRAAAHASNRGNRATQQRITRELLAKYEPAGLTADELERLTGWPHQSASARLRELVLLGHAYDSTARRLTQHGRRAVVRRLSVSPA